MINWSIEWRWRSRIRSWRIVFCLLGRGSARRERCWGSRRRRTTRRSRRATRPSGLTPRFARICPSSPQPCCSAARVGLEWVRGWATRARRSRGFAARAGPAGFTRGPSVDWDNINWSTRRPQMDFPVQVYYTSNSSMLISSVKLITVELNW